MIVGGSRPPEPLLSFLETKARDASPRRRQLR